jgi:Fic family protein
MREYPERRFVMKPEVPFNDLPLLPPSADCETPRIMKQLVLATRALAELKGVANLLPSQDILINTISLSEARSSSEIENIITTQDELYKALIADNAKIDSASKEVIRYREALWHGFEQLKKKDLITARMLKKTVQTITDNMAGIRNMPGIVIKNVTDNKILYTPPEGEEIIKDKLFNLEKFINTPDKLDPLIKMAIIHYQFEAIHPFFDGNGRTGRILNILYLVKEKLLDLPILYLSKYIIDHKSQYYQKLNDVTFKDAWEEWIVYMLTAVEKTAIDTKQKALGIQKLLDDTLVFCRDKLPKNVYSKELVELIFRQPYTKIQNLINEGIAERLTASKYLNELINIGVLDVKKIWKDNIYINTKLYEFLKNS